jgi:hypothetical protein
MMFLPRRRVKPLSTSIAHSKPAGRVFDIAQWFSVDDIAKAHQFVEQPSKPGRVLVVI